MTSYRTKEEVGREFDRMFEYQMESRPVDIMGLGERGANQMLQGEIKSYIHSLRLSDLESIIEVVEGTKIAEDKVGTFKDGHDCLKEQILSYLKSLKQ